MQSRWYMQILKWTSELCIWIRNANAPAASSPTRERCEKRTSALYSMPHIHICFNAFNINIINMKVTLFVHLSFKLLHDVAELLSIMV